MTPSAYRKKLESRIKVMTMIADGLAGKEFHWGTVGETKAYLYLARGLGISLITRNQAAKKGLKVKTSAKPVGRCNFGRGTSIASLFVEEVHCEAGS